MSISRPKVGTCNSQCMVTMACLHGYVSFFLVLLGVTLCSSNLATVKLNILNVNDYTPDFPNSISTINVTAGDYSNDSKLFVLQLQAEDNDVGPSGNVTYNISGLTSNGRDKFTLTQDGALWLVGTVKNGDYYVIVVEAQDKGVPPRQDHTTVIVSVQDETWEGPAFPTDLYTVRVNEGIKPDSHIITIQALDHDESLHYSIVKGNENENFVIDANSGILKNVNTMSLSDITEYMLVVEVEDAEGLTANTFVDIKITSPFEHDPSCDCANVNTSPSIPSELYLVHIGDGMIVNSTIFTIPAVYSGNDSLTYDIDDGNMDGDFFIDKSGDVRVAHALNYTRQRAYELAITATNADGENASTRLRILITSTGGASPLALDQGDVVYNQGCLCDDVNGNGGPGRNSVGSILFLLSILVCPLISRN